MNPTHSFIKFHCQSFCQSTSVWFSLCNWLK